MSKALTTEDARIWAERAAELTKAHSGFTTKQLSKYRGYELFSKVALEKGYTTHIGYRYKWLPEEVTDLHALALLKGRQAIIAAYPSSKAKVKGKPAIQASKANGTGRLTRLEQRVTEMEDAATRGHELKVRLDNIEKMISQIAHELT